MKYKLSMTNSGSSTPQVKIKVNLQIIQSGSINELCQFAMEKDKPDWFKMTIKSKLSSTNKITMMFQCEGENDFISIDVNTDDKFKLVFNSDDTNLISITNTPSYENIKNDFIVEGTSTINNVQSTCRYHLVIDALKYLPELGNRSSFLIQECKNKLIEHKVYIIENGIDMEEVRNWHWK